MQKIKLSSPSFNEGESIPSIYTCDDKNISPALHWDKPSEDIKRFAIIVEDPDAPSGNFIHWLIYNIPPDVKSFPEDITTTKNVPDEVLFGTNSFGHIGYGGPCPPSGTHRYFFKIYGLNDAVHLEAGADINKLRKTIEGHIVAEGELMAKYKKNRSK